MGFLDIDTTRKIVYNIFVIRVIGGNKMWKKIGIVLIFLFGIFVFSGCQFKPDQKSEDYEKVIQTIQNLPNTEDLVLADKENVEAAFSQYNALTESAKLK